MIPPGVSMKVWDGLISEAFFSREHGPFVKSYRIFLGLGILYLVYVKEGLDSISDLHKEENDVACLFFFFLFLFVCIIGSKPRLLGGAKPDPTLRVSQRVFRIRAPIQSHHQFSLSFRFLYHIPIPKCRKWKRIPQWSSHKAIRRILKIFKTKHPPVMLSSHLRSTPNACCRATAIPICLRSPRL